MEGSLSAARKLLAMLAVTAALVLGAAATSSAATGYHGTTIGSTSPLAGGQAHPDNIRMDDLELPVVTRGMRRGSAGAGPTTPRRHRAAEEAVWSPVLEIASIRRNVPAPRSPIDPFSKSHIRPQI
jgi:hypothetical protein